MDEVQCVYSQAELSDTTSHLRLPTQNNVNMFRYFNIAYPRFFDRIWMHHRWSMNDTTAPALSVALLNKPWQNQHIHTLQSLHSHNVSTGSQRTDRLMLSQLTARSPLLFADSHDTHQVRPSFICFKSNTFNLTDTTVLNMRMPQK